MVSKKDIMDELIRMSITEDVNELEKLTKSVKEHLESYVEDNRERIEMIDDNDID